MVCKKECKYRDFISTAVMKYCRKTKPQKFCKFRRISTIKEGACICLVGIEAAAGTLVAPKINCVTEAELIQACKKQDRRAQQLLFDRFSPVMFGLCKRYLRNREDAEDVLVEGFFKVLTKLEQFSGQGSFEGWIRRIMVNEALMHLRKNKNFKMTLEINDHQLKTMVTVEDELQAADILNLLDRLPTGYRTVFNLYVLEGYKHREIAEMLDISINTSKSQLILAKKRMQELVKLQAFSGERE